MKLKLKLIFEIAIDICLIFAFHKYFGIDTFYAPYIRLDGKLVIKNSYQRDLQLENNDTLELILRKALNLEDLN